MLVGNLPRVLLLKGELTPTGYYLLMVGVGNPRGEGGVALTPGPSPIGRGVNFGIDVGCGWLGMVCGMDVRSFGSAQDDMVCIWGALTPGPSSYGRGGMFGYCLLMVGVG